MKIQFNISYSPVMAAHLAAYDHGKLHDALSVQNSDDITFTLNGQQLTAVINAAVKQLIQHGATAYGWGNHAAANYVKNSDLGNPLSAPMLDANGILNINNIPKSAIEKLVKVTDDNARFLLTIDDVQNGDSVKVMDSGKTYFVIDENKLDNEDGFEAYTAEIAAAVEWAGVLSNPFADYVPGDFEAAFIKNTAFNKNFGTTAGTVAEGSAIGDILTILQSI